MQRNKCPLAGSRNSVSRYEYVLFFSLSFSLFLSSFRSFFRENIAEVYETYRAEMMPLYFSALNTAACYCVSGVLAGKPDNFVSRACVVQDTCGLRHGAR